MIISILAFPFWTGYQLTFTLNQRLSVKERLLWGFLTGHVLFTWLVFLFSLALGFNYVSIATATAILLALGIWLTMSQPEWKKDFTGITKNGKQALAKKETWFHLAAGILLGLLLFRLSSKVAMATPAGLLTGFPNNTGDMAWHLAQITSLAFGNNFPPENPAFSGTPLRYPFLANLFSAVFVKSGIPVFAFLKIQTFVFLGITLATFGMYAKYISNNKNLTPWLSIALLMFSGGLGFIHLIIGHELDFPYLLKTLFPPPYDLTGNIPGQNFQWMNFISALVITQRTLLFGLPISIFIICLLWWGIQINRKEEFLWAGLLAGGLPLFHGHAYIAIILFSSVLAILFRTKKWIFFFIPALVLALPQWIYLILTAQNLGGAVKLNLGWMAENENVLTFWARNLGLFLPLYVLGLWKADLSQKARIFLTTAGSIFVIANFVQFAPWDWDNIKLFLLWYLISVPAVAQLLSQGFLSKKIHWIALGAVALILTILSGALTVYRLSAFDKDMGLVYTREEITLAESLRELTPPSSIFLSAPEFNQIAFLAGRKSSAGYTGWLWSHGIDYTWREAQVKNIYMNPNESPEIIKELGIDYVIVGPNEKKIYELKTWEAPAGFKRFIKTENYEIYRSSTGN